MKNVLFFTCLFLWGSLHLWAQETYTISGKVVSYEQVLPGVTILVKGTNHGTLTDQKGNYSLSLPKGNYTLQFSYGNSKEVQVELTENKVVNVDLSDAKETLGEVFISSLRVDADSPITYSNLGNEEIEERNLGQDIPVLMSYMPSVVTTTDAGNGVGYTGIRVRGSDATRTNVTINGVPYNDAESQGSFWVNLGDFASSVENLQLQRGVGTSTNGAGAFGASINILTDRYSEEAYAEVANSFGSYNTHKHTAKFSTGLFNEHWEFAGRASLIKSDGYIDRASSELKSYFLQGTYVDDQTLVKALMFGGKERTYQAWYGIDGETLENDRTFNPAGIYTDEDGNTKFYDNQTDNYQQDHYQLLWNQQYNANWSSDVALHYTYGRGYYEEYQEDATLAEYGMQAFMANGATIETSDLVNTSWLDNHFYGFTFSTNYQEDALDIIIGGGWNRYEGDHFGEVIYTRFAANNDPFEPYYENDAVKTDFNAYGKVTYSILEDLAIYGDLQYRRIKYTTEGPLEENVALNINDEFNFFNPKLGLTYEMNAANQLYASFARAHREPTRTDYENALFSGNDYPKAERLDDYELGWRHKTEKFQLNANVYYMNYQDQLVLTGEIDDEGARVRENSGASYRLGLELDANIKISKQLSIRPNLAISDNKNENFTTFVDDEERNFGNTAIAFSPNLVAGNMIRFAPNDSWQFNLLSKFVGEQYMSNTEVEASKLDAYFVTDVNIQYTWKTAPLFKEIVFTGLVNNIFDEEYVSNGFYDAAWGAYYYPQATLNFLAGVTLKF